MYNMLTKAFYGTCHKMPCSEGSKPWDCFEMQIHKCVIDLHYAAETVKQIVPLSWCVLDVL